MNGWRECIIDDVFDVARGGSPRPIGKYITDDPDGINWIMIGDTSDRSKYITRANKKILRSGLKKTRMVYPGDFLLTNSMSFGRPYINQIEGCIHDGWLVLRPRERERIHPDFFYHLLGSPDFKYTFEKQAAGAVVKNLNTSIVKSLQIRLPKKIEEQRRIADILDKADSIRRKREEAIAMMDTFLRAAFLDRFGHPLDPNGQLESSKLGAHCDFFGGNSLPTGEDFTGQNGGLFLLKVSDLNSPGNETVIKSAKLWAPSRIAVKGGVVAPGGSVVFPKRGGAIATNKKRVLERDSVLDPNLMAVVPKVDSVISKEYLHVWFDLINLQTISSGSSVPQLNKKDLAPLAFGVPKRGSVEWFSNIYEFVRDLKDSIRFALVEVDLLFSSLSQRAFRGEL